MNASPLSQHLRKTSVMAWLIFFVGILYYCFAYLLRVYPSIMEFELLRHFNITASTFGLLTSFYYFAYAPMQLPVGVTVDKIGPRRSLLISCATALIGIFLFAQSDHYCVALLGRFLVGLGASFAYVTALKLASIWLPQRYFATATGLVTGSGMLAVIITDIYLTNIVQTKSFYHALYFPLIVGITIFILIFLIVYDKPVKPYSEHNMDPKKIEQGEVSALSFHALAKYLIIIIKSPQMWLIGIVGALLYLPSSVFLDLWGIPYLEYSHHFSPASAAIGVSVMLMGWACSSFITGALSDVLGTRKAPLVIATFGSAFVAAFIIYVPNIPKNALYILLFIFGTFCGPHSLCFTMSKENFPQKISGTAIAFTNFIVMMGGFIFQPIVGQLLDMVWSGQIRNGVRIYTRSNYMFALSLLPISLFLAGFLSLYIKETYSNAIKRSL